VIRPELAKKPGAPKAVREAHYSWFLFKYASEVAVPGFDGMKVIHTTHDVLVRDFLTRLLVHGATDRDIQWLIQNEVMSSADVPKWEAVVSEFAESSFEVLEDAE
jgi:hypothetical protein